MNTHHHAINLALEVLDGQSRKQECYRKHIEQQHPHAYDPRFNGELVAAYNGEMSSRKKLMNALRNAARSPKTKPDQIGANVAEMLSELRDKDEHGYVT